ncbi:MAG TPA: xanthine dehydrogenase family protein molybdopterin-binding subunit [Caldithrix abyssi]|uniref:Xanthine dehydrogenase family protein molybdopterin-binding subunit n=1 Tax=Caldithrix abyssi TaxID=187145 RepID=A0A7V5PQI9_CALAY|nr:xanthine dehydrogenase family protein molybdopterin-binding subunit [Caldithrix abyssi]
MKANPKDYRVDAIGKLHGQTRYIRDEQIPGLWFGTTIRSPHPRARIKAITFDPTFDWQQMTVVTAQDIPNNYVAMLENDMPFLAADVVNYVGEPVVLIAAPEKETLTRAAEKVHVEYEPMEPVLDMLQSETSGVKIFSDHNIFKEIQIEKGDLKKAQQAAFARIEIESRTGFQEHLYLEPQGMIAIPEKDRVVIKGSMQCPYYIKNALDQMFAGRKTVTVIQAATGGAFGGKEDFPSLLAGHAALLAVKSGHPVAMFYDREEDVRYTTKRHPSYHRDVAYVDKDGRLLGLDLTIYLDGSAYCTLSQVVLACSALTATGSYHVPNVRIHAKAVATNTVPSGAFRGFGGPQAVFAIEMLMEQIAQELKLPPEQVRRVNLIREGQTTATGQTLRYSVSSVETFEDVLARSDYREKYKLYQKWNKPILERLKQGQYPRQSPDDMLKGIGISAFLHGAGFTGTGENKIQGKIRVEINGEGFPVIFTAQTEMGQGEQTAFRKIMADTLDIDREQVSLAEVNTDHVPNSGPTVASRSTMVVGSLIVDAGKEIINKLTRELQRETNASFEYRQGYFYGNEQILSFREVAKNFAGLTVEKQYTHPPIIKFDDIHWKGDAYPVFSWAAAVAEVEVDPITFETRVTEYYTTHEIGKAINYDQSIAQIQGGTLQGIGYAIYEKIGLQDGHFDITGFTDYIIPSAADMPEMDVKIMENPFPFGPFGAKGLGELPLVGAAPAVVSALRMIFNYPFNRIPIMPEDLLKAVQSMKQKGA